MTSDEQAAWAAYLAKHHKDPGCQSCMVARYKSKWDDEPGIWSCEEHPSYGNLRSFPFKKVMPCFQMDFWVTPFADQIQPLLDEEDTKIKELLWQAWVKRGSSVEELEAMSDE